MKPSLLILDFDRGKLLDPDKNGEGLSPPATSTNGNEAVEEEETGF